MTSRRPTLLCAAEPWGFGPSAKLFAIVRELSPAPRIVAAGTGSAAVFARLNADAVDEYIELESPYEILSLRERCDAVLSVMDPWAALHGARSSVPVVYVDSLFWFWQWDQVDFAHLPSVARQWAEASPDELRAATSQTVNWHIMAALACLWSRQVFAQRAPGSAQRAALYPAGLVRLVGAVVAARTGPHDGVRTPLVSMSGAISHLTPQPVAARYAGVIRQLLARAGGPLATATVTGNPAVLPAFSGGPWQTTPMGLEGFSQAAASASVLLAPAGLTTALEAAALGTPMIFLPEQHGGHAANAAVLTADDPGAYDDILLQRWFDLSRTDPAAAIADLDQCYRQILAGQAEPVLTEMARQLGSAVESMSEPRARAARIQRQRHSVLGIVGDFDGAQTIAAHVSALLGSPGRRRHAGGQAPLATASAGPSTYRSLPAATC